MMANRGRPKSRPEETTDVNENAIVMDDSIEQVQDVAEQEQKGETMIGQVQEKELKKGKEYAPTDPIKCRSVVQGRLLFRGTKSQNDYIWDAPNDEVYVEYQDLRSAKLSKHQFLMRGYFIIEDDELLNLEEWKDVKKIYGEMYSRKDLNSIFRMDTPEMVKAIESLPDGVKAQMGNIAKGLMENGALDSISKIKAIDSILGTDLMLFVGGK